MPMDKLGTSAVENLIALVFYDEGNYDYQMLVEKFNSNNIK